MVSKKNKKVIERIKKVIGAVDYELLPIEMKCILYDAHMAKETGYGYSYGKYKADERLKNECKVK